MEETDRTILQRFAAALRGDVTHTPAREALAKAVSEHGEADVRAAAAELFPSPDPDETRLLSGATNPRGPRALIRTEHGQDDPVSNPVIVHALDKSKPAEVRFQALKRRSLLRVEPAIVGAIGVALAGPIGLAPAAFIYLGLWGWLSRGREKHARADEAASRARVTTASEPARIAAEVARYEWAERSYRHAELT